MLKGADGLSIESDYVLAAVGRSANVDGMNLEGIGVKFSSRGIKVEDYDVQDVGQRLYDNQLCFPPHPPSRKEGARALRVALRAAGEYG